ncbi:MAG: hypothetical protein KC496_12030 [Anaerolineae bacterium]|nr:hypothetical protein [Anaerolineae bacterium]
MKRLRQVLYFLSSHWWQVLLVTALNFASFTLLFSLEARFETLTGQPVYDTQNALTPALLRDQLGLYQGEARQAYFLFAAYDFIFPFVAALFVAVLLTWLLRINPTRLAKRLLNWNLPLYAFIGTLFDWMENISLLTVLGYGSTAPVFWVNAAILFKRLKLIGLSVSFTTLFVIAIFTIITWLRHTWKNRSQLLTEAP